MPQTAGGPCEPPGDANSASGGLGIIGGPRQRNFSKRDQFRADLALYFGSHRRSGFGGDYQDGKSTAITSYSGGQQVETFNNFGQVYYEHDFFARSLTDPTPTDSITRPHVIDKSLYLQDSWRAAPGLTVDGRLRWDQEDARGDLGGSLFKTTAEWQPRLGIVWDPSGKGKTKLYASAGRFYWSIPTDLSVFASPVVLESTYNFDPVDETQDPAVLGHPGAFTFVGGGGQADRNLKGVYQDELTMGIETLLDPTLSVGVRGDLSPTRPRDRGTAAILDPTSPENDGSGCATLNPGSDGKYAGVTSTDATDSMIASLSVSAGRAPDARCPPSLPRHRAARSQDRWGEILASGLLRLFVPARQLRRGSQ